jgi:hypothetical protein
VAPTAVIPANISSTNAGSAAASSAVADPRSRADIS